jgi:hypothetical protein
VSSHFLDQLLSGVESLDESVDVRANDAHRDLHARADVIESPCDLLINGDVGRGHVLLVLLEIVVDTSDGIAIGGHDNIGSGDAAGMASLSPLEGIQPGVDLLECVSDIGGILWSHTSSWRS